MPSPRSVGLLLAVLWLSACQATPAAETPAADSGDATVESPESYLELVVGGVLTNGDGHAVVLLDEGRQIAVPIFVGEAEALSIALRQNRQRYERPLTHDLLDAVISRLGGELVKIQIDDIRGEVFVGAVFIRHQGKTFSLDARPSDAIALALGHRVPIFVHERVVARAGIRRPDGRQPEEPSSI
jgi:uncharacterized protein